MIKAKSMDGLKPCPNCFTEVGVVSVKRSEFKALTYYYFVNCERCGEGTQEAFQSLEQLSMVWNQKVQASQKNNLLL